MADGRPQGIIYQSDSPPYLAAATMTSRGHGSIMLHPGAFAQTEPGLHNLASPVTALPEFHVDSFYSRDSPSPSSSSSGYGGSSPDESRDESKDEGSEWSERVVYASTKYGSSSINPVFNHWSPISEDDQWLDDLEERLQKSQEADADLSATEVWSSVAPEPTEQQPAMAASGDSPAAAGVHSGDMAPPCSVVYGGNALFSPQDARRNAVVQAANLLPWRQFSSWAPMPNEREALLLALIAQAEQDEIRRVAALKRAAKAKKYHGFSRRWSPVRCAFP